MPLWPRGQEAKGPRGPLSNVKNEAVMVASYTPPSTMKQYWYRYAEMRANAGVHADAMANSSSYHELNMAMRHWAISQCTTKNDAYTMGDKVATGLYAHAIDYWSDFEDIFPHHFSYAKIPEDKKMAAYAIVTALNKVKGGAWAYALCLKGMPEYEAHPLRQKILDAAGLSPADYDETVGLMRTIIQSEHVPVEPIQLTKTGSI